MAVKDFSHGSALVARAVHQLDGLAGDGGAVDVAPAAPLEEQRSVHQALSSVVEFCRAGAENELEVVGGRANAPIRAALHVQALLAMSRAQLVCPDFRDVPAALDKAERGIRVLDQLVTAGGSRDVLSESGGSRLSGDGYYLRQVIHVVATLSIAATEQPTAWLQHGQRICKLLLSRIEWFEREFGAESLEVEQALQALRQAHTEVGRCHALGIGAKRDDARAVQFFSYASELGCPDAQFALSGMHRKGLGGLAPDAARANALLRQSADLGHKHASLELLAAD